MKYLFIVLLSCCMVNVYGQEEIDLKINNNRNINLPDDNLSNLPFEFGIEFGLPIKLLGKSLFVSGVFTYLNVKLSKNNVAIKIEYGRLWVNKGVSENSAFYGAIGIIAPILNISKSDRLNIDFGYGLYINKEVVGGGVKVAISFFHSFSKITNAFISLKLPAIHERFNDEFYNNPFLTVGFQIF